MVRTVAPTLAAVLALAATPVGLGAAEGVQRQGQASAQFIYLQASAGDDSIAGLTDLTVTGERNGFRLRGYVEADRGCVEIRAVNMHAPGCT